MDTNRADTKGAPAGLAPETDPRSVQATPDLVPETTLGFAEAAPDLAPGHRPIAIAPANSTPGTPSVGSGTSIPLPTYAHGSRAFALAFPAFVPALPA